MIGPTGRAMICDFGCAADEKSSHCLGLRGTLLYKAPELYTPEGWMNSKQSDVWAFGMTIYVCDFLHSLKSCLTHLLVIDDPSSSVSLIEGQS